MTLTSLPSRIEAVRQRVATAAERAGRSADEVTIVAVSKTVDRAAIDAAYACGLRHFGENRLQDVRTKLTEPLPTDATMHMIGRLQTNKARLAVRLCQMVESVDRTAIIDALERESAKEPSTLPILLQVNIAGETQKAGCPPGEALALARQIQDCAHLSLRGLMTIAPLVAESEATRPVFRGLRQLRDELLAAEPTLDLGVLSMGMTNDFEIAIEEGATQVRIGRAIFSDEGHAA